jgi:hypothetical protein
MKKTSPIMERKVNFGESTNFNNDGVQGTNVAGITPNMTPPSNRPQGCKRAEKDQKARKQTKSSSNNAQAQAIVNMAVATWIGPLSFKTRI